MKNKYKIIVGCILGLFCLVNSYAQTSTQNYIIRETVLVPGKITGSSVDALDYTQKRTVVEYYDGLGRLLQVNNYKASGDGTKDLFTPVIYDAIGRQAKDYLPFSSAQNMAYYTSATAVSNWTAYYGSTDDDYAYSEKTYDNSLSNRVMEQSAPGNTWRSGSGHTVKYDYGTNTGSEVLNYTIDNSTGLLILTTSVYYPANSLYKTTTWDENATTKSNSVNRVSEYRDKRDRVILERSYIGTTAFSTYYVYNDKGLLCCVIPPKVTADDGTVTSTELAQLCYQYKYDERDRLIEKKLPGAERDYLIYDSRDRLVLRQDGKLRSTNQYQYTLYDYLNRPLEQGICTDTAYVTLRGTVKISSNYTPTGTKDPQICTYYDNYNFRSTWGGPTVMNTFVSVYDGIQTDQVKGLVTGTKTKVLGSNPVKWIYSESYYDKYERLLQYFQGNPEGGFNRESYAYDFEGKITDKQTLHKQTSSSTEKFTYEKCTYDHMGRQLTSQFGYNTTTLTTLATNVYDDLGRLSSKRQHNSQQYCDYTYNIRGWLTQINDPTVQKSNDKLFAMKLFYDADMSSSLTGGAQFNGNINGMMWRRTDNTMKGYNFSYDGLNRLTSADFGTYSSGSWVASNANDFSISSYDPNGNINGLSRNNAAGSLRDNLTYVYAGNQLSSISGTYNGTGGKSGSFTYDGNGNAISDGLRGLTTISYYPEIDLPKQYYKDANNKVDYQYDASGIKWSKTATIGGSPTTFSYYGPFVYQGTTLVKILTPDGFCDPTQGSGLYHYYLKDHLGNTRITYYYSGTTPTVIQEVAYDPFGYMLTDNTNGNNKYLYNGKELQDEFFENYDFSTRFYDAQLGIWHQQDMLLEESYSWSPYCYVLNNPIVMNDPTGMFGMSMTVVDPKGQIIYHEDTDDDKIYRSSGFTYKKGDEKNMEVIGVEEPGIDYSAGRYLRFDNEGNQNTSLLNPMFANEGIENDYTIESFVIPIYGFIKFIKVGKYLFKLVPTKTGKYLLKFVGLTDDAAKSGTTIIGEGMARVEAAAASRPGSVILNDMPKFTGTADQVTSQMMQYNRQWILNQMRSGRSILDIGLDVNRANPSIFYQMEQNMIKNYQILHPGSLNIIRP
ncbi:MAG: DUF6443 domain-containing protein [Mangrovibacterium sp.]